MLKGIPIGRENFKDIIENNFYYIDKTKFIEELLLDGAQVKLFCRPRRFGKTLNMYTLKYFFDIRNGEENRKLFKGLYIENSLYIAEQGKYPVIFISMKGITSPNWKEAFNEIKLKIKELFKEYRNLIETLDKYDIEDFEKYILREDKINEADLKKSLRFLTELLYRHYKQKVIVLIDEYDSPILTAYEKGYYTEMKDFLKAFYGDVFKTNEYLQMGVLTGIVRVTQAGIFSDLNNIENYTILRSSYSQYFGLLENEVEKILQDYGMEYKLDEVKSWYDGYNFSGVEVYNPLSILKYVKEKELAPYWINTSGNDLIFNILANSSDSVLKDLEILFNDKELETYINLELDISRNLIDSDIWSLMLASGYLTLKKKITRDTYIIKIPNNEIKTFFKDTFIRMIFKGTKYVEQVKKALLCKNLELFETAFQQLILESISFYNTTSHDKNKDVGYDEIPYQMFMLGFLTSIQDRFFITPEQESGLGRADIILEPKNKNGVGYILEIKSSKKNKKINTLATKAYKQIEEKKYDTELKRRGITDIVKIGIVFKGKTVVFNYK